MERLDRGVRADRHELGRLDDAMAELEPAEPRSGAAIRRRRDEDLEARRGHPVISARSTNTTAATAATTR